MGLFTLTFAGGSFILIGTWESLSSHIKDKTHHRFSTSTLISSFILSLLFIFNSLFSLFNAFSSKDNVGSVQQLQILSISSLFLLFSLLGLFTNLSKTLSFPYPFVNLILLFAFVEEFLLFHLHLKDSNGIENRYFDLMLVPILMCIVSTLLELKCPQNNFARLGRGVGLILQGTWFIQMGFSFFTYLIVNNCFLHYKSRGNYTIKCKGHMDSHRGGAIAVLLFNCHLALLVALIFGFYAVFGSRLVDVNDYKSYTPIGVGGELPSVENRAQFTLDSDSDDGGVDEIKPVRENGDVELTVNGFGSHH